MAMKLIEITIVLVIVLMIFAVILTSLENTSEKIIKVEETNNMEKLISEVVDNLINNPGKPDNWNEYRVGTPGLAIINDGGQVVPNSVSYDKLIALGKDYDKFIYENMFGSQIHSSIELIPHERSISSVKIGDFEDGNVIYSVNRLVKCNFYKNYVIRDFENDGTCNKHHDQKDHSCNYFKVFPGNLRKMDYYLLIDDDRDDLSYLVETTRMVKSTSWQTPDSKKIHLNDMINFYDDDHAIVFIHLDMPRAKAVLVSVPKDFNEEYLQYDYFKTTDCDLVFSAWY
ncbi:type II secretion system protein [Methanobrevibacter sp.]